MSTPKGNVFAFVVKWLVLMTPPGEPCHVLQHKLGHALQAAGPTHVEYVADGFAMCVVQWSNAMEGLAAMC